MGDELNDNSIVSNEFRRKRPVPMSVFSDRYVERPYLKKEELSMIRDNLDALVDIKVGKDENKISETKKNDTKIDDKSNVVNFKHNVDVPIIISDVPIESKISEIKVPETKVPEVKIGIGNLVDKINDIKTVDNKVVDNKVVDNKVIDKKIENKTKKIKVNRMNDEDQGYISPEMRKQIRKSEMEEYHNEKEMQEYVKKSASLAEQNRKELEDLKKNLTLENLEIRKELKNEFGNKVNELSGKFNDITSKFENVNGKFDGVTKKLEETCTGIDCLKKDLANINKNMDLSECETCGNKVVPPFASYCPSCSAKQMWYEDDGVTPVKGWKPSWKTD